MRPCVLSSCTVVSCARSLAEGSYFHVPGGTGSRLIIRSVGGGVVAVPRLRGIEGEGSSCGRVGAVDLVHHTIRELVAIGDQVGSSQASTFLDERSGELEVRASPDLRGLESE